MLPTEQGPIEIHIVSLHVNKISSPFQVSSGELNVRSGDLLPLFN